MKLYFKKKEGLERRGEKVAELPLRWREEEEVEEEEEVVEVVVGVLEVVDEVEEEVMEVVDGMEAIGSGRRLEVADE